MHGQKRHQRMGGTGVQEVVSVPASVPVHEAEAVIETAPGTRPTYGTRPLERRGEGGLKSRTRSRSSAGAMTRSAPAANRNLSWERW